jgi:hypothetical protein
MAKSYNQARLESRENWKIGKGKTGRVEDARKIAAISAIFRRDDALRTTPK